MAPGITLAPLAAPVDMYLAYVVVGEVTPVAHVGDGAWRSR